MPNPLYHRIKRISAAGEKMFKLQWFDSLWTYCGLDVKPMEFKHIE